MVKAYDTSTGKLTFDIGVKRTSDVVVGMMTRKDNRSVPAYQVYDDEFLASQFFTGEPGYGSLPTEKELAIRQDDWRSGFGLDTYDSDDPKRYLASYGMDMRFRGMGIAGPIATMIYGTSGWRSPTSSTDTGATWNQDSNAYDDDTTTAATWNPVGAGTSGWFELNITSTPCDSVRYYVGRADAHITEFELSVYYSSAWTLIASGTPTWNAWTTVAIGSTQNVTAARLRFTADAASEADIYELDFNIAGNVKVAPVAKADFNDYLYVNSTTELWKVDKTAGTISYVRGFPANITSLEVFGSNLFIALGISTTYWYMSTGEGFTLSTEPTCNKFKYFKLVDAAAPVLWGSDSDNTIRSTLDPANGGTDWGGVTTIGASYDAITGLFSDAGSLYINKEDMPYYLNSSGAVKNDLAPELAIIARSADNGKSASFWMHNFYLPWGSSLLENDSGVNTWRSPNDSCTQLDAFVGQVFAVVGDDHYLFAIIDYGTKIEVLAGRPEVIDGTTRWVWHPINETTLASCETCWVSSVYQKRLWISPKTTAGVSLIYIPLPLTYGNVLADTNRSFLTGTTMETSWLHGNFKSTIKAYIKLELVMGHTYEENTYFTVKYKKLGDTSWTTIGNYTGSATSMIQSRYIPDATGSVKAKSTLFKLQFTAICPSPYTTTPVLLSYHLKAVLYPDQREIIAMKIYCANEIVLRDGGTDSDSYQTIIDTLDEARTATYPVTIYDLDGTARVGKFLPLPSGTPRWKPIANEANRLFEREYNLLFQLIPVA